MTQVIISWNVCEKLRIIMFFDYLVIFSIDKRFLFFILFFIPSTTEYTSINDWNVLKLIIDIIGSNSFIQLKTRVSVQRVEEHWLGKLE